MFHQVKRIPLLTELRCEALPGRDKGRPERTEVKTGGVWAEMRAVGCCGERRDDTKGTNKRWLSLEKKLALNLGLGASRNLVSEAGRMWAEMGQNGVKSLLELRQDMGWKGSCSARTLGACLSGLAGHTLACLFRSQGKCYSEKNLKTELVVSLHGIPL